MRRAGLSVAALAVVAVVADVVIGDVAVLVVAFTGLVGLMFVAIWQLAGARHTCPSTLDQCSPADQKRVRTAISHPEEIAGLPRPLREVVLDTARQQAQVVAVVMPWWVSCVLTFTGVAVWRAVEEPSPGGLLTALAAGGAFLAPAAYFHQALKGRAVLAEFAMDADLREP